MTYKTIDQKASAIDFAKARELIEARGGGVLSLQDRRVVNVLYENAGERLCDDLDHVIGIVELRGNHKGGERVTDSIRRLMKTLVEVPTKDKKGRPATKLVPILSDTTVTDDENNPAGYVTYSFSPGMRAIIKDSTLWGRVRNAVVFALTSKYSVALYELGTARINMSHVWQEEFSVEDFRALVGVPEGKLERIPNLLQRVINPAVKEVNKMATFGVKIEPIRTGGQIRGLVTGFRMSWWKKNIEELKAAHEELNQPKFGRKARLNGTVETITCLLDSPPPLGLDEKVNATIEEMRRTGAPDSDIKEFLDSQTAS